MIYNTLKAADPEVFIGTMADVMKIRGKFNRFFYWGSNDEESPMARSEWIEILGLLVGKAKEAMDLTHAINNTYTQVKSLVNGVTTKPKVFSGTPIEHFNPDTGKMEQFWIVPGRHSDEARLITDAGGDYLFMNSSRTNDFINYTYGISQLNQADYWFDPHTMCYTRTEEFLGENSDLGQIKVVQKSNIFMTVRRVSDELCEKNDALEGGVVYPYELLRDCIKILHPEVLNNTHKQYYQDILPLSPSTRVKWDNTNTYPVNCKYGDWEEWRDCTSSCGAGIQFRIRNIRVFPKRGGAQCSARFDVRDCVGDCKTQVNLTVILIIVAVVAFLIAVVVAWYVGRRTAYIIL